MDAKITLLAQAVGGDVKNLINKIGDTTALNTTAKGNLVAALNEVYAAIGGAGAQINDNAGNGDTLVTWSADKIFDSIALAKTEIQTAILGGASAAYDTLKELQDLLEGDAAQLATLASAINNRVRFDDVQTLTSAQKLQARSNIDAVATADVTSAITAAVGDTNHDFVADYTAAKA
jgi:hypothetical protein